MDSSKRFGAIPWRSRFVTPRAFLDACAIRCAPLRNVMLSTEFGYWVSAGHPIPPMSPQLAAHLTQGAAIFPDGSPHFFGAVAEIQRGRGETVSPRASVSAALVSLREFPPILHVMLRRVRNSRGRPKNAPAAFIPSSRPPLIDHCKELCVGPWLSFSR